MTVTTRTISASYATGLSLGPSYNFVSVTATGSVNGTGLALSATAEVINSGKLYAAGAGADALNLNFGGYVVNGNIIEADVGVRSGPLAAGVAAGTVMNHGFIIGSSYGVQLLDGGTVTNYGSIIAYGAAVFASTAAAATITNRGAIIVPGNGSPVAGIDIGAGRIANYGTVQSVASGVIANGAATIVNGGLISGNAGYGVRLLTGGALFNDAGATIQAAEGVSAAGASVANSGTISGLILGVALSGGAHLTNGSSLDRTALIKAANGVAETASTVTNYGTIESTGLSAGLYSLHASGGSVRNQAGAVIEGYNGATFSAAGALINNGLLLATGGTATNAASFAAGGTLTNGSAGIRGAVVEGYGGVAMSGTAGTVANFATIEALGLAGWAVSLAGGGQVNNGSLADQTAQITGYSGVTWNAATTVANFGTILARTGGAVSGLGSGKVVNGAVQDRTALIDGYSGVYVTGAGSVINYGSILSLGATGPVGAASLGGGTIVNGTVIDSSALLSGAMGARMGGGGAVSNFGSILGATLAGVSLTAGGRVTNGGGADTAALISGVNGVDATGAATVSNFGTINGFSGYGVVLRTGGSVANGGGLSQSATIEGYTGVEALAAATVSNSGVIIATAAGAYGVNLTAGGRLTNGSATNATAVIEGYGGARLAGGAIGVNFATIKGAGDVGGAGLALVGASSFSNGSAIHPGAVITGYTGAVASASSTATLTNYGTIVGLSGAAVTFNSAADVLVAQTGAVFVGAVKGGGGTLDLASGTGTITSLFAGGVVTETGSATTFSNFGALEIGTGASFAVAGNASLGAGQNLIVAGTLGGTGTLSLAGGNMTLATGASPTIAHVSETSATSTVNITAASVTVGDVWTQTAGTVTVATGAKATFTGVGDVFSGTLAGAGAISFTAGSDTLAGTQLTATTVTITGATVTLSGALSLAHTAIVTSPNLTIAAAGATLTGLGSLELSGTATNALKGGALTNTARLLGTGLVSVANVTNSGTIEANLTLGLTLTATSGTVTNSGTLESASAGGLTVTSAVANSGSIIVTKGTLAVDGALSGAGQVLIEGGTADLAGAFTGAVTFNSAGGTLMLAHSITDTVTVTGLAKTNITKLDLQDIAFTGATVAFSGTSAAGTLTVTNGGQVAHVTLIGNYTTSTFVLADDGTGHVLVSDPPPVTTRPPIGHRPLIAAMAAFGAGDGAAPVVIDQGARVESSMLARPA